jgi:predicted transcriptional regulator
MNNGWIKLHRKSLDNEIFRHDRTAWHVFETLLILCDTTSGSWSGGMYQLSDNVGELKPTVYKAILRLEKAGMINRLVNARYTVYNISNWKDYQYNGKQRVNSEETASNTLTRIKNKELRTRSTNVLVKEQVFDCYKLFIKLFDKNENTYKLTPARKSKLQTRIRQSGVEQVKQAIENTANSDFHRGDNDRGWTADFDFIIRSQEQIEKLATMNEKNKLKRRKDNAITEVGNQMATKWQPKVTTGKVRLGKVNKKAESLLLEIIEIVNPLEKITANRIKLINRRLKENNESEILQAAQRFSKSKWHIENKQMSIDNLIRDSKFDKWLTESSTKKMSLLERTIMEREKQNALTK